MTQIKVIFHLPSIVLEGNESFPLGYGRVETLSFEQWQQIDNAFCFADSEFCRVHPSFWIGEINIDRITQDSISGAATEVLHRVHSAFLLELRLPWIPSPVLSVMYCQVPLDDDTLNSYWMRCIGPMEREWVVYGSDVTVLYDAAAISQIDHLFKWMEK